MLICLLTRFEYMLIPLLLMVVKEVFTGITGLLVIRRTKEVHGAAWHGKAATVALYIMMIVHLLWVGIPTAVSHILVGICVALILLSFVLYAIRNIRLIVRGGQYF